MRVADAVVQCLEGDATEPAIEAALRLLCDELDVDRVSLHAVDAARGSFRVIAGGGGDILAPGTELPLDSSTQVAVPARGTVFACTGFAELDDFDQPLDHLVMDMGYRSGASVPLFMGSRPVGALCASSRNPELSPEPVLDVLEDVSAAMTLAFHAVSVKQPRVLVCMDDELGAQGVARVVESTMAASVDVFSTREALEDAGTPAAAYQTVICDAAFHGQPVDAFLASLRSAGANGLALVVATNDSPMSRALAARGGAAAYVARSAGAGPLAEAVRGLMTGEADAFAPLASPEGRDLPRLTRQEANVLLGLERGLRFKQIALELDISESTAKGYARSLFVKLGAHSRGEAVHEARRCGLLDFLTGG